MISAGSVGAGPWSRASAARLTAFSTMLFLTNLGIPGAAFATQPRSAGLDDAARRAAGAGRSEPARPAEGAPPTGQPPAASPEAAPTLHALGDSTAAGVGARSGSYVERLLARLVQTGRSFRLANLSESGATTSDVLRDQVVRVKKGGTTGLVLVGVGVNDLTRNVSPEAFGRQFESVITGIRARTGAPIVVSNLPDISLARAIWPDLRPALAARVDSYNSVISRIARKHGLVVFDTCAMTRQTLPAHPEYLSSDGFHPSDKGYQAWADGLWQVVQRVL